MDRIPRSHAKRTVWTLGVLLASAVWPACSQVATTSEQPALEIQGHMRRIQGTDVLFLRGSNRERGFAEGYLRGDALRTAFRGWALKFFPASFWDSMVLPLAKKHFRFSDRVRERAEAVHAGMKARGKGALAIPELERDMSVEDILVLPALADAAGLRCSSLAVFGKQAKGRGPLIVRNLDYRGTNDLLRTALVIVQAPGNERHGTVSIGWTSLWMTTGISDVGAYVAIHDVRARRIKGSRATPRLHAIQDLLERLDPGEDPASRAAKIFRESQFAMGGNLMLAWSFADFGEGAAILEFGPHADSEARVTVREPGEGMSIACTNHWRTRRRPSRCWRYKAIQTAVAAQGEGPATLMDVQAAVRKSRVGGTLHTVSTDLRKGELSVEFRKRNERDEWRTVQGLELEELFEEARTGRAPATEPEKRRP